MPQSELHAARAFVCTRWQAALNFSTSGLPSRCETLRNMKPFSIISLAIVLAFAGCEQKTTGEKVKDKVDDALDRRPGEKARDAAEDLKDAAKDAGREIKGAVKDARR